MFSLAFFVVVLPDQLKLIQEYQFMIQAYNGF